MNSSNYWWGPNVPRHFVADANGDARADLVAITPNGDLWVAVSTGTSFAPTAVWAGATVFSAANGWFNTDFWPRVLAADVTGDGKVDVVGVANNGDLWIAESTGSAFKAPHNVAASAFATPAYFSRGAEPNYYQNRMWVGDVNGDGKSDIVGISTTSTISVSLATGSGDSAAFAPTAVWRATSVFNQGLDWFNITSKPRVWLADVTGDGARDFVGIANNGDVWVSESLPGSSSFAASHIAGASNLRTTSNASTNFFDVSSAGRVWVTDVTGDGKADVVAIAPAGVGDGDIWLERASASAGVASFTERVALRDSVFKSANGWFNGRDVFRTWVADVTGDGRADFVGVAFNGDVWVARSASEVASATAPVAARGTRDFFQPSIRTSSSIFNTTDWFLYSGLDKGGNVISADVTGDGAEDLLGFAIAVPATEGTVYWHMPVPTAVTGMTDLTKQQVDSGQPQTVAAHFSRSVDASTIVSGALRV
ncbi:MAG: FG-GAP repeat domain-containing protein, partial [bacterium]